MGKDRNEKKEKMKSFSLEDFKANFSSKNDKNNTDFVKPNSYEEKASNNDNKTNLQMLSKHLNNIKQERIAKAPYNFVSLNEKVIHVEEPASFNKYHDNTFTGYIDLEIENITPLYIRGTNKNDNPKAPPESEFFSPNNQIKIPGSSLRGMVRTLVEIVTYGNFGFFNDDTFYYRSFADQSHSFKDSYTRKIKTKNPVTDQDESKALAGYLKKEGKDYVIYPAVSISNNKDEPEKSYRTILKELSRKKYYNIDDKKVKYYFSQIEDNKYILVSGFMYKPMAYKVNAKNIQKLIDKGIDNTLIQNLKEFKKKNKYPSKYFSDLQHSLRNYKINLPDNLGPRDFEFDQSKKYDYIINPIDYRESIKITLDKKDIRDYKLDREKNDKNGETNLITQLEREISLLKKQNLNSKDAKVPCFYVINGNKKYLGHTPYLRVLADKSIEEKIPSNIRDNNLLDMTHAIFGLESDKDKGFASRVFFEDAVMVSGKVITEKTPKILASPKPTTFQHYLVQNNDDCKKLNYYDSNSSIRGNKMYFHKGTDDAYFKNENWTEKDQEKLKKTTQYTKIKPIDIGSKFRGKIRFENLTKEELGSLLFTLNLPKEDNKEYAYKLGMGKPLGLGSIKINSKLYISDRKKRYTELFGDILPELKLSDNYINSFQNYVIEKISYSKSNLWENDRLQELLAILEFDTKRKNDEIRYLEIENWSSGRKENEYRDRKVLPLASEVFRNNI